MGTWNLGSPRSAIEKHKEYSNLIKPDVGTLKHGNPSAEINMQAESSSEFDDEGDINKLQEEKGLKERIFQHGITDTYRGSHSLVPKARSVCHYAFKKKNIITSRFLNDDRILTILLFYNYLFSLSQAAITTRGSG